MRTRRGEGSSNRQQTRRIVSKAIRPIVDLLEDRRLLAATPVISFDFNTDPAVSGVVTNTGSGGAAYNGTLAVDTKGGAAPTFQNATPRAGGGGYLNFTGDGAFQGMGGRIDLATQLQGVLGGTGTISFYVRSTQKVTATNADLSPADAVWQSPSITGVEQAGLGNDIFLGDINHEGKMRGQAGDGAGVITSSVISDGNWHQVAITRDATSGKVAIYVDGALQSSATGDTGNKTSPFNSIGALTTVSQDMLTIQGYDYYNGDLDQVDIYNTALSAQDIATMYGAATAAPSVPVLTNKTSGPGDARFNIGPVTDDLGLTVLRSDSATGTFNPIAQLAPDSTSFADRTVVAGQTYYYKVAAFNNIGTTESAVLTAAIPTSGTGLKAYYYNTGFWGSTTRPVDTSHIVLAKPTQTNPGVATVDYDFGNGGPSPIFTGNLLADNFSTAYLGTLIIPKDFDGNAAVDTTYTVKLVSNTDDDGGIYANGQIVAFDPNGHGGRDADDPANTAGFVSTIQVTEGVPVDIAMLQAEQGGGAVARLKWEVMDNSTGNTIVARQIIPEDFLHTAQVPVVAPGLNSVSTNDPYSINVDYSDNSNSEIRYELLRSTGSTFNAATAKTVALGAINSSRMTDLDATPGQTYTYVVRAVNSDGFADSAPSTYAQPAVTGDGVVGHYFNSEYWKTGTTVPPLMAGAPDVNALLNGSNVDFNWGNGSPTSGINADNFSTIFTGKITIPSDGDATPNEVFDVKIYSATDDAGYVFVNGVLVSSDPGPHGAHESDSTTDNPTGFVNTIKLTEGQSYNFLIFQDEIGGGAESHLKWVNPVTGAREAIPASAFTSAFQGPAAAPTAIAAPTAFLGAHQVKLTWTDNATNEVRYEIERAVVTSGVAGPYSAVASLPINSTSFVDSGLTNNTTYSYRIRAYAYDGATSTDFSVTTLVQDVPPDAPTAIAVAPRSTGVLVTFTDNSINEAEFVIQRAPVVGGVTGTFGEVGRVPASAAGVTGARFEFNDASAVLGTTYVYRVHSTNPGGNSADITSGSVTAAAQGGVGLTATWYDNIDFTGTTFTQQGIPPTRDFGNGSPDATIGADQFSGIFVGTIKAEFSEKYTFFTDSDDGIELTLINPDTGKVIFVGGNGIGGRRGLSANNGFADTAGTADLVAGKKYIVQVRFVEDGGGAGYRIGWSSPSLPLEPIPTDLTFAPGAEPLFAPQVVSGGSLGAEKITLSFYDNNISDTGYIIERGNSATGTFTQVGTLPGNVGVGTQTFTDDGSVLPLQLNQTYYYRLRAIRNAEVGPNSTPIAVSTTVGGTDLVENGNATVLPGPDGNLGTSADNVVRLVDNVNNMSGSVWTKNVQNLLQVGQGPSGSTGFHTSFQFAIPEHSDPAADGFTFAIQRLGNTVIGGGGGGLGYSGLLNSYAVGFKVYTGATVSNIAFYQNGVTTDNGTDIGFPITNGHNYKVDVSYDDTGKTLNVTITDLTDTTVTPYTNSLATDIPGNIGGSTAFVGFTGATGGLNIEADISNWSFNGTALPFVFTPTVAAPKVTNVYVKGSAWTAGFKNYLAAQGLGDATYGYNIAGGATQLKNLPWTNINQISIKFDSDVSVTQGSLIVKGVNNLLYGYSATTAFSYDAVNHVGTWTLAGSVAADKMLLQMASGGVTAAGSPTTTLDGEYVTSTTVGASGDGVAGGDFNFRLNVLPGDVAAPTVVNNGDVSLVKARQGTTTTSGANYGAFFDVDGSGVIQNGDVSLVKARQGTALPAGEPAPAAPVASEAVTASAVAAKASPTSVSKPKSTPVAKPVVVVKPAAKPIVAAPAPKFAVTRIKKNDLLN